MLNNLTNFFNLITGRMIKKTVENTDLIPLGTKHPGYDGGYAPTAIKFEDLQAQLGGGGTLQQVTDLGNTTTNNINLDNSAIVLSNGSLLQKGYIDNGADGGIARICSIGYQDEWENGVQYFISQNSNQIVWANSINNTVPDVNFDITMGYVPGSMFHDMNNQRKYICTDSTSGAAVWDLYYDAVETDGITITGNGTSASPLVATGSAYKVYTAEISQLGTNAPTANVLENTLGGAIVWSRATAGNYVATLSGAFTVGKTICFVTIAETPFAGTGYAAISYNANQVEIRSIAGGIAVDNTLSRTPLEIRVYN